jgi:cobalt/nickel transport system permease protein
MPFILFVGVWLPILDQTPTPLPFIGEISSGWIGFAAIIGRSVLSVAVALGLLGMLGWSGIMRALSSLHIPSIIRIPAELLHRHLFGLFETAGRMLRARELRGGKTIALREWGGFCGQLLLRSIAKGERVERALLCRGFAGEWPALYSSRWGRIETIWTVLWIGFFASLKWGDLASFIGKCILKWI